MEIKKTLEGNILTLRIEGDFDTTETEWFAAEISEAVEAGQFRVLLDLEEMSFVNSTALGVLLRSQKRLAQFGGGIAAVGAGPDVTKTFKLLELDRRIPLKADSATAIDFLERLTPESVPSSGEEVEFQMPERSEVFGERPRRGCLEEIHEEGLSFTFDNLEELDVADVFGLGSRVLLRFRLPLYHPTHVFKIEGKVDRYERLGRETVQLAVRFTDLSATDREAVEQYVKDLRFLRDEK